jgi:ABC-type branched-subunit amino acid transport system permease subunit
MRRFPALLIVATLVGLAGIVLLPLVSPSLVTLLSLVLAKGIVVLGIIILLQAGQVSFGHAMFFGAGAYAVAFYGRYVGTGDMLLYLVFGALSGGLLGLIIGLFVVRYREIFFGMLNLAFSMVLWSLLEKMFHYTNGADGMRVARPTIAGLEFTPENFSYALMYLTFAIAVVAVFATQRMLDSPLGHMLRAIKSNETRLEYLGISARRVLLAGYVISAVLGGLGGSLVAAIQQIATPEFAYWTKSGEFVFIAILGGAGHALGAFAGATVFEFVRFYASARLEDAWQMILGAVLIAIILLAPAGLVGLIGRRRRAEQSRAV